MKNNSPLVPLYDQFPKTKDTTSYREIHLEDYFLKTKETTSYLKTPLDGQLLKTKEMDQAQQNSLDNLLNIKQIKHKSTILQTSITI